MYDFQPQSSQNIEDTLTTLALLSSFVIIDMSTPGGQFIEYGDLSDILTPVITIAEKGGPLTGMARRASKYWIMDKPFRFDGKNMKPSLETIIEKKVIPKATLLNRRLYRERIRHSRRR